jgi:hypothetical protein
MPIKQAMGATRNARSASSSSSERQKTTRAMTKTFEVISEAIRNPKHPFRKADNRPKKPMKHRYERRKIREYLHLGDWQTEEAI